jgi:hypothetical protein
MTGHWQVRKYKRGGELPCDFSLTILVQSRTSNSELATDTFDINANNQHDWILNEMFLRLHHNSERALDFGTREALVRLDDDCLISRTGSREIEAAIWRERAGKRPVSRFLIRQRDNCAERIAPLLWRRAAGNVEKRLLLGWQRRHYYDKI